MAIDADLSSRYERDGFVSPIRVMDQAEAARLAALTRGYAEDPDTARFLSSDAHMVFRFVDELVRRAAVVDAVQAVLGPDVMLLRASCLSLSITVCHVAGANVGCALHPAAVPASSWGAGCLSLVLLERVSV